MTTKSFVQRHAAREQGECNALEGDVARKRSDSDERVERERLINIKWLLAQAVLRSNPWPSCFESVIMIDRQS